jgi:Phage capsid family
LVTGTPGLDAYLQREIVRSIFTQLGAAVLIGAGPSSNQPLGVLNTPGVNFVTFGSSPTWPAIVGCEVTAATANISDFGNFVYVVTPTELGVQKETPKGSGLLGALTDTNGFDTLTTTILNSGGPKLVAGPFDWVLLGIWGSGVDILIDRWTQASAGLVVITTTVFADVLCRHPEAFTIGN